MQQATQSIPEWLIDTTNLNLPSDKIVATVAKCSTCGKIMAGGGTVCLNEKTISSMAGSARYYNDKIYCDMCYENEYRKNIPIQKCSKCDSEYEQNIDYYSQRLNVNTTNIYKGKNLCPHCYAIQQHDNTLEASRAYREKLASVKKPKPISIAKLSPAKTKRLTNKNWMNVAYKTPGK